MWYSDCVYGMGSDIELGIKQNDGWMAFCNEIGIWGSMSRKDQASKNNLIFMCVDKTDRATAGLIAEQARSPEHSPHRTQSREGGRSSPWGGGRASAGGTPGDAHHGDGHHHDHSEDVEAASRRALEAASDSANDFKIKADRQLSRAEFVAALVKLAIERFVKSKQNPNNELDDVSDAVERLFIEYIEPRLADPLPGHKLPKLPSPDAFRTAVCYTREMSHALSRLAPSLRVLFAGLAKLSFENGRAVPPALPKVGKTKVSRLSPSATSAAVTL